MITLKNWRFFKRLFVFYKIFSSWTLLSYRTTFGKSLCRPSRRTSPQMFHTPPSLYCHPLKINTIFQVLHTFAEGFNVTLKPPSPSSPLHISQATSTNPAFNAHFRPLLSRASFTHKTFGKKPPSKLIRVVLRSKSATMLGTQTWTYNNDNTHLSIS